MEKWTTAGLAAHCIPPTANPFASDIHKRNRRGDDWLRLHQRQLEHPNRGGSTNRRGHLATELCLGGSRQQPAGGEEAAAAAAEDCYLSQACALWPALQTFVFNQPWDELLQVLVVREAIPDKFYRCLHVHSGRQYSTVALRHLNTNIHHNAMAATCA